MTKNRTRKKSLTQEEQELVNLIRKETGIKIRDIQRMEDNEVFKTLLDNVEEYFKRFKVMRYNVMEMNSIVGVDKKTVLRIHNSISFHFPDDSVIRFSPFGMNGIEISRVWVTHSNQGKGIGSKLMELLFQFLEDILGEIPPLYLECNGSIGFGERQEFTPISKQTSFFRKFGFRVKDGSDYPHFLTMTREIDNNLVV